MCRLRLFYYENGEWGWAEWVIPYDVTRVYYWEDDEAINYGSVITINGVSELHYISIAK